MPLPGLIAAGPGKGELHQSRPDALRHFGLKADALRRQARGEDTSRWEVLDFPGFDADGPIE